jgi:hypothetical protein
LLRTLESRKELMYDENELNRIWNQICNEECDGEYSPQKVFENKDIQIMYVPSEMKIEFEVYERRRGGLWVLLPAFKKQA